MYHDYTIERDETGIRVYDTQGEQLLMLSPDWDTLQVRHVCLIAERAYQLGKTHGKLEYQGKIRDLLLGDGQ